MLYELEAELSFYGKSVTDFGLRLPPPHLLHILRNRAVMEERSYNHHRLEIERDVFVPQLNIEQRVVFDKVIDVALSNR